MKRKGIQFHERGGMHKKCQYRKKSVPSIMWNVAHIISINFSVGIARQCQITEISQNRWEFKWAVASLVGL